MSILYIIYRLCSYPFQMIAPFYLQRRLKAGKEIKERYQEKLGKYDIKRPRGKLIWIHVASVGEMNSILPIIRRFGEINADVKFLVTSFTVNSSRVFDKAGLKNTYHQFVPMDCPKFVMSFLNHWKPSLGIFIDSETWPNLIIESSKRFPLLMLNGRLSDLSYKRWNLFGVKSFARLLYNKFTKIMPTSRDDERKIGEFADAARIKNIGNLKYAYSELKIDKASLHKIEKMIGKRPTWVAASTHPPED